MVSKPLHKFIQNLALQTQLLHHQMQKLQSNVNVIHTRYHLQQQEQAQFVSDQIRLMEQKIQHQQQHIDKLTRRLNRF